MGILARTLVGVVAMGTAATAMAKDGCQPPFYEREKCDGPLAVELEEYMGIASKPMSEYRQKLPENGLYESGCAYVKSPEFARDSQKCLEGDSALCVAVGQYLGDFGGIGWNAKGDSECVQKATRYTQTACDKGMDCVGAMAVEMELKDNDSKRLAKLDLKQIPISEKLCFADSKIAPAACIDAMERLMFDPFGYQDGTLVRDLDGDYGELPTPEGFIQKMVEADPERLKEIKRVEAIYKAGCDKGVKIFCRKIAVYTPRFR